MSTKCQERECEIGAQAMLLCPTCKNMGFIVGTDEVDKIEHREKSFIEECPDCNIS